MDVLHLSEVDSTSTYAAELLAQGKQAPFLIHADCQTGGRGRRGNRWASPKGNLFVTIALPGEATPPDQAGLLPLKAGVVLASMLRELTGLRLTLKWPNDLLFSGCKLGGLLLESSFSGQRFGDLLIGFGLNCAEAPALADYGTTCLSELLGRPVAVAALVQHLAAGFIPAWNRLPLAEVVEAYGAFAVQPGHLWQHADDGAAALLGLTEDGGMRLAKSTGEELRLNSADHGWRWIYQRQRQASSGGAPLLVADVGNTALKLARFSTAVQTSPDVVEQWAYDQDEAELVAALHRVAPMATGLPLFIATVQPQVAAQLSSVAAAIGLRPQLLAKRAVRSHGQHYAAGELGIDRLAGIEAWLAALTAAQRASSKQFGLIVQAGTATTIDAVGADGEHLGGLILPGLTLSLRSLHETTALLPLVVASELTVVDAASALGHDTRSAMSLAVVTMTVGAVERVIRQLQLRRHLQLMEVVVSGGWATLLAPLLDARVDSSLVLAGAKVMALGG